MKGYDIFFENPGEVEERSCQVCYTRCEVIRGKYGPTSWVEGMGNRGHLHDYFYCPHVNKPWHQEALRIVLAIQETPSKRLAALMQADLIDLLAENGINLDHEETGNHER